MKKYAALLLSVLIWMGCKKTESGDMCGGGTLQVINNSNYPFKMEVDGTEAADIPGAQKVYHTLQPGTYQVRFIQADGFVVSPTVYEYYIDMKNCDTGTLVVHKVAVGNADNPSQQ